MLLIKSGPRSLALLQASIKGNLHLGHNCAQVFFLPLKDVTTWMGVPYHIIKIDKAVAAKKQQSKDE